jgi:hypothetical protein
MADSGRESKDRLGAFHLGACHERLGPGLGQLYEAWRQDTGTPVLLVRPSTAVDWQPEEPLGIHLFFRPEDATVSLEVESRTPPDLSDVTNLLVLTTAAVTRVEEDPQVRAHVASGRRTVGPSLPSPASRNPLAGRGWMIAGLAGLTAGICVWLCLERDTVDAESPTTSLTATQDAMTLGDSTRPGLPTLAYPLPQRPFRNQAVAPCYPQFDEVEINGGCWIELGRHPPCQKDTQADYKGKCYLPISKDRDRGGQPAQSVNP